MGKIFIGILVIFIFKSLYWFISVSNKLKRYCVVIDESKKNVDIALAKRYDTISEMIKVAKSFARHETDTFSDITKLRQEGGISESNLEMKNQNDAISRIYALAEAYPDFKSSEEFLNLQDEIDDENEKLAAAKRIVNSNISKFNQVIVSFPNSIVANANNMKKMDFLIEDNISEKKSIENFDYSV